jgi:hypothetical protein
MPENTESNPVPKQGIKSDEFVLDLELPDIDFTIPAFDLELPAPAKEPHL